VTTSWCYGDIVEVVLGAGAHLDVIALPKVEHASHVWFAEHLLSGLERDLGLEHEIRLELVIETAAGARDLPTIAQAGRRVDALVFGPGDYAASLGIAQARIGDIERGYHGHQWHWVMSQSPRVRTPSAPSRSTAPTATSATRPAFARRRSRPSTSGSLASGAYIPSRSRSRTRCSR